MAADTEITFKPLAKTQNGWYLGYYANEASQLPGTRFTLSFPEGGIETTACHKGKQDMAPTVLREGPYRFYFVSHDLSEPPHVHIDRDNLSAKFWLQPVGLAYNLGFSAKELRRLETVTAEYQQEFLEAWNDYFGTQSR